MTDDEIKALALAHSSDNVAFARAIIAAYQAKLRQMYALLASAWFYGNWKAETYNERQMQKLMEDAGYWPTSESEIVARAALGENE